ncbi:MAG: AraC family transcriptional regulator [Saonia sp.]
MLPVDLKKTIDLVGGLNEHLFIPLEYFFPTISFLLLVYSFLAYINFKKYYNKDFEMSLWLKLITSTYFCFGVSWWIYYIASQLNILTVKDDYFITFSMVVFVGLTTYFGLNYSEVFNGKSLKKIFPVIKYEKSGLSKKVLFDLKDRLHDLVETNELYLDSELKLTDLAEKLNISRHHTSQIINECFGMSFYEYINKYRVEEAEKILMDGDSMNLNITEIAYKSGFNNRMSFYNSFKKHVGITPSEYRNQNLVS